jgi:hypothetical protein
MIIGGGAQANSKNQFPSQKKISENSSALAIEYLVLVN